MSLRERWDSWLAAMQEKHGRRRVITLGILIIVGIASITIHSLLRGGLGHTALLYLAVPYGAAMLITLLRSYSPHEAWWQQYSKHAVSSLVVFFASSAVLGEGFICVLFFIPIYLLGITLVFVVHWLSIVHRNRKGRTLATTVPLLVAFLSLEGTTDATTFSRHNTVTATASTAVARDLLLQNVAHPRVAGKSDNWILSVFPMPHAVEAEAFEVGAIHTAFTRYHRWFVTNTHEGALELRIDSIAPERITTSVVSDTTFFSSYVDLLGTELEFATDENGLTQVSLTISYERRLDPAWYFQPVQKYAMQKMADHLLEEVIIRD